MINVHFRERERGNMKLMVGSNLFSIRDPNRTSIMGPVDSNAINNTLAAVFHSGDKRRPGALQFGVCV